MQCQWVSNSIKFNRWKNKKTVTYQKWKTGTFSVIVIHFYVYTKSTPISFLIFAHMSVCVCVCVCVCVLPCPEMQTAPAARKCPVAQFLDLRKHPLKLSICDTSQTGHTATLCSCSLTLSVFAGRGGRNCMRELKERDERRRQSLSSAKNHV